MAKPGKSGRSQGADVFEGSETAADSERIAKAIARAGLCSRREAETLIAQGRVELDGATVTSPAIKVTSEQRITVDGEPLPRREPPRLWRYHKPTGLLTAARDPEGRPTVFDRLPPGLPRVMPVGRLDLNSEGLLLLTNDGGLKRQLELPATGWRRRYRVRVYGTVAPKALQRLREGIEVEGVRYGPIEAALDDKPGDRSGGANTWLTMALREGKNREIRRVCQAIGLKVSRLLRLSFGPFQLGALKPGEVEEVPAKVLKEQLGAKLADELGIAADAHRRR